MWLALSFPAGCGQQPTALSSGERSGGNALAPEEAADGWTSLFDGQAITHWKVREGARVQDGTLVFQAPRTHSSLANLTHPVPSRFTLVFEYAVTGRDAPVLRGQWDVSNPPPKQLPFVKSRGGFNGTASFRQRLDIPAQESGWNQAVVTFDPVDDSHNGITCRYHRLPRQTGAEPSVRSPAFPDGQRRERATAVIVVFDLKAAKRFAGLFHAFVGTAKFLALATEFGDKPVTEEEGFGWTWHGDASSKRECWRNIPFRTHRSRGRVLLDLSPFSP